MANSNNVCGKCNNRSVQSAKKSFWGGGREGFMEEITLEVSFEGWKEIH